MSAYNRLNHLYLSPFIHYIEHHSYSVLTSDAYWNWYILVKYLSEIVLLILELIISTVITSYETSRSIVPTFPIVHNNDLPAQTNSSTGMELQQEMICLLSAAETRADISDTYTYTSTTDVMPHITSLSSHSVTSSASYSKYGSVEEGSSQDIYGCSAVRSTSNMTELSTNNMTTSYIRTDSE